MSFYSILSSCRDNPSNIEALSHALAKETSLNLTKMELNLLDIQNISTVLANNKTLTILNLSKNNITAEGAIALAQSLKTNTTLKKLDLRSNNVRNEGAIALASALKENKILRELILDFNKINEAGANALGKALTKNKTLRNLSLRLNIMSTNKELAKALKNNCKLSSLSLGSPCTDQKDLINLIDVLDMNSNLKHLALNHMSGQYISICFDLYFKKNKTLTSLDLSFNSEKFIFYLTPYLKHNTTLKILNLAYNKFNDTDLAELAAILKTNQHLTHLNLIGNDHLSVQGFKAFSEALVENTTLLKLDYILQYTALTPTIKSSIEATLKRNNDLYLQKALSKKIEVTFPPVLANIIAEYTGPNSEESAADLEEKKAYSSLQELDSKLNNPSFLSRAGTFLKSLWNKFTAFVHNLFHSKNTTQINQSKTLSNQTGATTPKPTLSALEDKLEPSVSQTTPPSLTPNPSNETRKKFK